MQLIEEISDGVATLTFNRPDRLIVIPTLGDAAVIAGNSAHGPSVAVVFRYLD
jgi:hypothetical protein